MKIKLIVASVLITVLAGFVVNDALYTNSWYNDLHVAIERAWLGYHDDRLDGVRDQAIREQRPLVMAQAMQEMDIEICNTLPESSFRYFRDKEGNISFIQHYTGANMRPHREVWYPRTECQREYIETTLSWELCPKFDRVESWSTPNGCRIQVARAMRKMGLVDEASKGPCEAITNSYEHSLCLDQSYD